MLFLGVDPDTGASKGAGTAWAVLDIPGYVQGPYRGYGWKLHSCGIVTCDHQLRGYGRVEDMIQRLGAALPEGQFHLAVVEGQHLFPGSAARPNDINKVALVAGACAGLLMAKGVRTRIVPAASTNKTDPVWKRDRKKDTTQNRILDFLGKTRAEVARAAGCSNRNANHVIDAIGLAMFAAHSEGRPL